MFESCQNLVVLDPELGNCRFSHLSVQEYLEDYHWTSSESNRLIGKVFLSLLNSDPIAQTQKAEKGEKEDIVDHIFHYARLHWATHVEIHGKENFDKRLIDLLRLFLGSVSETRLAYQMCYNKIVRFFINPLSELPIYDIYERLSPPSKTTLEITTLRFHKVILDWRTTGLNDVEQKNDQGDSSLILGSIAGSTAITQASLARGSNVNATGGSYENAFQAASFYEHEQVVRVLLNSGSHVNATGGRYSTAVQAASSRGVDQVVRSLYRSCVLRHPPQVTGF